MYKHVIVLLFETGRTTTCLYFIICNYTAVVGIYTVTRRTARNLDNFTHAEAQGAIIVYNYNCTKGKLCKTNTAVWYKKRAKAIT